MNVIFIILLHLVSLSISAEDIKVWGPGLQPIDIIMPARYFLVQLSAPKDYKAEAVSLLTVDIKGNSNDGRQCRIWTNKLDRKDGTFIVRYKLYEPCHDLSISILYNGKHIFGSPFEFNGIALSDNCNCPKNSFESWFDNYGCEKEYHQIEKDLENFNNVHMDNAINQILKEHHRPEAKSFCHYTVKHNEVFRKCYGKHVGFNMFADNILLSLARKVILPDMELVINLGDWPLIKRSSEPLPVFSWCGSEETSDIVMPTYDITESTLENMGRVTLDTLSVQGNVEHQWQDRENKAIWRGRDSRAERLKLIDIARAHPDLFNASLTNFFFFRDKEAEYGPKQPHISFYKFFDYKYQINIDGTVAAYRLPYLLAGGGAVFKQDSPYYEHFYKSLVPWTHYIPIKHDISDLVEKVKWARDHDSEVHSIAENARMFSNENLLPQHIFCYHAALFKEWSNRLKSVVKVRDGMERVPQVKDDCACPSTTAVKDEL